MAFKSPPFLLRILRKHATTAVILALGRNGKLFRCAHCGNVADADVNAALNIATRGYVNLPMKDGNCCRVLYMMAILCLKPKSFSLGVVYNVKILMPVKSDRHIF